MNQEQYDIICKVLRSGAPALADELITSLSIVINDYQRLKKAEQDRLSDNTEVQSADVSKGK